MNDLDKRVFDVIIRICRGVRFTLPVVADAKLDIGPGLKGSLNTVTLTGRDQCPGLLLSLEMLDVDNGSIDAGRIGDSLASLIGADLLKMERRRFDLPMSLPFAMYTAISSATWTITTSETGVFAKDDSSHSLFRPRLMPCFLPTEKAWKLAMGQNDHGAEVATPPSDTDVCVGRYSVSTTMVDLARRILNKKSARWREVVSLVDDWGGVEAVSRGKYRIPLAKVDDVAVLEQLTQPNFDPAAD